MRWKQGSQLEERAGAAVGVWVGARLGGAGAKVEPPNEVHSPGGPYPGAHTTHAPAYAGAQCPDLASASHAQAKDPESKRP